MVIGAICVVLAAGLLTAGMLIRDEAKSVRAYFAEQTIPAGKRITEDMLASRDIPGNFSSDAAVSEDEIVDKFAAVDIVSGDVILRSKLTAEPRDDYSGELDGEHVAISVSIKSFAYGLSGHLRAGDVVSVFASYEGHAAGGGEDAGEPDATYESSSVSEGDVVAPPELKYVSVLAVTGKDGTDRGEHERALSEDEDGAADAEWSASTVTFLVSPDQAELLAELEANGVMQFALVYRGEQAAAGKFLAKQDEYLKKARSKDSGSGKDPVNGKAADAVDVSEDEASGSGEDLEARGEDESGE
jgi:pilus assembly protein CpaB